MLTCDHPQKIVHAKHIWLETFIRDTLLTIFGMVWEEKRMKLLIGNIHKGNKLIKVIHCTIFSYNFLFFMIEGNSIR